ncbi:hypothetical protein GQ457_17G010710 [Hibiscus cannabinus]
MDEGSCDQIERTRIRGNALKRHEKRREAFPLRFISEYRYPTLSIDTLLFFTGEYRYPISSIDTLSCKSAFIAGRKLPNGSIDDLTYQNGWKSVRRYKNKLLKLQQ